MKSFFSRARTRRDGVSNAASSTRNALLLSLFAAALCALPPLIWKIVTYRRDLKVRDRFFLSCPPLGENERLLILMPHPDDETLATGGLIVQARQRNLPVRVVFLTNGDGSGSTRWGEIWRRRERPTYDEIAVLRQREARAALRELGVADDDVVFLGYPDGGLMQLWRAHWETKSPFRSPFTGAAEVPYDNALSSGAPYAGQSVVRDLVQLLKEFRPTRVVTTDGNDLHLDHRAAFCFLLAALEQWRATSSTRNASAVTFWTALIHHAIWPVPHGFRPHDVLAPPESLTKIGADWRALSLDTATQNFKCAALERYESQMTWTPHYLRGFLRRNELFNVSNFPAETQAILRASTHNSPTQSAFAAVDLQSLKVRCEDDELSIEIEARAPLSHRATYVLLIHALENEHSRCHEIIARFAGGSWHAQLDDATEVSIIETSRILKIALRRGNFSPETHTLTVSVSARWNGKTLDETSTVAVRL